MSPSPSISLVVPVHDEVDNLEPLAERIEAALVELTWELILVDDGSTDGSDQVIRELHRRDPRVRGVFFERNAGQTAAIAAGFERAVAPLVATLDADLQNDPADLPAMLAALEDHDAVVGWRRERHDSLLRRLSSRLANAVRNRVTGDSIRDTGCSLKLFRREVLEDLCLFEGMHRFLPTLLRQRGHDVIEVPVAHHPRVAGVSKYGLRNRAWRALKDLLAVRWMGERSLRHRVVEEHGPTSSAGDREAERMVELEPTPGPGIPGAPQGCGTTGPGH